MKNEKDAKIPVVVIFAPTATGKTEIVGRLFSDNAPSFFAGRAEIISADSMQAYRGFDIGTAKAEREFLAHLPHHLIDVVEPQQQFGSGEFLSLADEAAEKIWKSGKVPVVCGGTAFYIKQFIFGSPVTPVADEKIRSLIQLRLKNEGSAALYQELCKVDPIAASKIHPNDEYRICRALEVFHSSGKPLSSFDLPQNPREQYDFLVLKLSRPIEILYERINLRVLRMFDLGLVDEVRSLLSNGITQKDPAMGAIGYREFFTSGENPNEMFSLLEDNSLVDGIPFSESPRYLVWLSEIKRQIQRNTRHYAKKQFVFFRQVEGSIEVHTIDAEDFGSIENCIKDFMKDKLD